MPAGHASSGRHKVALIVVVNVPGAHAAQARSAIAEPDALTNEPGSQVVHVAHEAAFSWMLKVPLVHCTQTRSVVAVPGRKTCCPGTHDVCVVHAVAGSWSSSHVPGAHGSSIAVPPAQKNPSEHGAQTAFVVSFAAISCFVPGGQAPLGKHAAWFTTVEWVPASHAVHTRSEEFVPGALTKVPGAQSVHGVQELALRTVLAEPLAHETHVRSVAALPSAKTRCPGRHCVHGTQDEADEESWSQVPGAQGSFAVEPPGQYVPGSHATQTLCPSLEVAGLVPAGHESTGRHASWLGESEVEPSGHGAHAWSAIGEPLDTTKEPGSHTRQRAQFGTSTLELNVPLGHAAHVLSAVDEDT